MHVSRRMFVAGAVASAAAAQDANLPTAGQLIERIQ